MSLPLRRQGQSRCYSTCLCPARGKDSPHRVGTHSKRPIVISRVFAAGAAKTDPLLFTMCSQRARQRLSPYMVCIFQHGPYCYWSCLCHGGGKDRAAVIRHVFATRAAETEPTYGMHPSPHVPLLFVMSLSQGSHHPISSQQAADWVVAEWADPSIPWVA